MQATLQNSCYYKNLQSQKGTHNFIVRSGIYYEEKENYNNQATTFAAEPIQVINDFNLEGW